MSNDKKLIQSSKPNTDVDAAQLLGGRSINANLSDLKGIENVTIPENGIPVTINFDRDKVIGSATVKLDSDGNYVAEISTDMQIQGFESIMASVGGFAKHNNEGLIIDFSLSSIGIVPKIDDKD